MGSGENSNKHKRQDMPARSSLFGRQRMDIDSTLPYSMVYPVIVAVVYALLVRFFMNNSQAYPLTNVMAFSFAVVCPVVTGAITVYMAEQVGRQSIMYYAFAPWLSICVMLIICAILLIEGSICIVMAAPLFLGLSSIGGLAMGVASRTFKKPPKGLQCVAFLPFIFLLAERPAPDAVQQVTQSIFIKAPAEAVWRHINFPSNIHPSELAAGLAYKIGVPYPQEARTLSEGVGGKRRLQWQRGIVFEEEITAWQPNRHIAWKYIFRADSFPPGSMDEHVELGGKYFDLTHTSYTLSPENGGTRLDIVVDFRVSTAFNWYALPMAEFFIHDTAGAILQFYKNRSERAAVPRKAI